MRGQSDQGRGNGDSMGDEVTNCGLSTSWYRDLLVFTDYDGMLHVSVRSLQLLCCAQTGGGGGEAGRESRQPFSDPRCWFGHSGSGGGGRILDVYRT